MTEREGIDLLGALARSLEAVREQRRIDNTPCPACGGDRLRTDFTGTDRCHAPITRAADIAADRTEHES